MKSCEKSKGHNRVKWKLKKTLKICSLVKVIILQPDDTCYFSFEIYCSYLFLFFVFFHYYCVIGVHFGDLNLQ